MELLSNHTFMISRQIIRLIIYYIMPLIFVSIFYILIAKHLFQTKSVVLTPFSTQPFINRGQLPIKSTKQTSNNSLVRNSNIQVQQQQQQRHTELNNNINCKKNPSITFNDS